MKQNESRVRKIERAVMPTKFHCIVVNKFKGETLEEKRRQYEKENGKIRDGDDVVDLIIGPTDWRKLKKELCEQQLKAK